MFFHQLAEFRSLVESMQNPKFGSIKQSKQATLEPHSAMFDGGVGCAAHLHREAWGGSHAEGSIFERCC